MRIAVTGANGYIGNALLAAIAKRNLSVLAMSRKRPAVDYEWLFYDLNQSEVFIPNDISCVIHLAMNLDINSKTQQDAELKSAENLLGAANKISAMFIYLSSQTAYEYATTFYGETKWLIEKMVVNNGGVVIRPGLVYGGKASGLFLKLRGIVQSLPFIPYFLPSPQIQPIHVDDLCESILRVYEMQPNRKILLCAEPVSLSFYKFLKLIARVNVKKMRLPIPVPTLFISILRYIFPTSPVLIRLHSLFTLPKMSTEKDLLYLGVNLRELSSGLHVSGSNRRRALLREASAYFHYLGGEGASLHLLKSYVRVIESLKDSHPIGFGDLIHSAPLLIALLDNNHKLKKEAWYGEFLWRLDAATCLLEATPFGARRFLRYGIKNSFLLSFLICVRAVFFEALFRLSHVLCFPLIKFLVLRRS